MKPANVFLHRPHDLDSQPADEIEQVKVVDFGVSKIGLGDATSTATGALIGSPAYMSPEQARGEKHSDPRSDLWSLGVVLFEMIAGSRPFPKSTLAVLADILSGPIPRLSTVVAHLDPRIDEVVARCLIREIDRRMPSAQAMIDALRALAPAEQAASGKRLEHLSMPDLTPSSSPQAVERTAALPGMRDGATAPVHDTATISAVAVFH